MGDARITSNLWTFTLIATIIVLGCFSLSPMAYGDIVKVPLIENLGTHHHPISSPSHLAQRYFDQGLILTYGFNHKEAERSFREATRLDPDCGICYWGVALVLGSNLNAAMDEQAASTAWEAIQKALQLSDKANEQERAYIQALAKRYSPQPIEKRQTLELNYAKAMGEVAKKFPNDLDAATLFAEALMNTMPWDYWQQNGEPKPKTRTILATLDSVLERNPNHVGANHLYIHATEAVHPELAIAAADRLGDLVPAAGHLVHMPSHIYIRVGRYHDAVIANQKAIIADQNYLTQSHEESVYSLAYVPHNHHFLWAAAIMEGNQKLALTAADNTASMVEQKQMREPGYGTLQHYYSIPLYTLTRFGRWDEILAQPSPAEDLKYPRGVWHYARGMAFTGQGKLEKAAQELDKLNRIAVEPELEKVTLWEINTTANLLQIAAEVLAGKIAAQREDYQNAIAHLKTAVNIEDNLTYDEPPPWYYPVRQSLGAVLIKANRALEAETIFQEDLQRFPENGWSLFGLAESLQPQEKNQQAKEVQKRFANAWKYADFQLDLALL
jgi:tetratricopeptide (TPR) repeat protein